MCDNNKSKGTEITVYKSYTQNRLNVAISLVNFNGFNVLKPMLESLIDSDISDHNIKLFYWDNGSTDGSVDYVNNLKIKKEVVINSKNIGIVIPRIRLMDLILSEEQWDYTLEIHSDMLFPKKWFNEMTKFTSEKFTLGYLKIGVIMPYILTSERYVFNRKIIEDYSKKYRDDIRVYNCLQVHPWLLNNECIKKIGYYRSEYNPHRFEDTDLIFRVYKSKYLIIATKNSIVYHKGGYTRKNLLKRNRNEELFFKLNNMNAKIYTKNMLKEGGHPVIYI